MKNILSSFRFSKSGQRMKDMLLESDEAFQNIYSGSDEEEEDPFFDSRNMIFLSALPAPLLVKLLLFLPPQEIFLNFVFVSREFYELVHSDMFYKTLVECILQREKKLKKINSFLKENGSNWERTMISLLVKIHWVPNKPSPRNNHQSEEEEEEMDHFFVQCFNSDPLDLNTRLKNVNGKFRLHISEEGSGFLASGKDFELSNNILRGQLINDEGEFVEASVNLMRFLKIIVKNNPTIQNLDENTERCHHDKFLIVLKWKW